MSFTSTLPRFIGFGTFNKSTQVQRMHQLHSKLTSEIRTPPLLMVGATTTYDEVESRPKNRPHQILFSDDRDGTLNVLHYADNGTKNSGEPRNQERGIHRAIEQSGSHLHVIQLDIAYPDLGVIGSVKDQSRHPIMVILKLQKDDFTDPEILAETLGDFGPKLDGVLLDLSMPELISEVQLRRYLTILREGHPSLSIAIAGGMDNEDLLRIEALLPDFPRINVETFDRFNSASAKAFLEYGLKLLLGVSK